MSKRTKVTLAFYKANGSHAGWDDKIIAWYTNGSYSHVELIIEGKDGYEQWSSFSGDGGVRGTPHRWNDEIWDYVEIEVGNFDNILSFLELTKHMKYDYLGLFGFILPIQDRTNKWFCSEYVSNALKITGYEPLWCIEPSSISPNLLYKIVTSAKTK